MEQIKEALKKLPGVSIVLVVMTFLGARFMGVEELQGIPLVLVYGGCAVGYWMGKKLDEPIYDWIYKSDWANGTRSWRRWLPRHKKLDKARKSAFDPLFKPRGVETYAEAEEKGLITDKKGIYSESKRAAVAADGWEGSIAYIHDWSKAARTLFAYRLCFY